MRRPRVVAKAGFGARAGHGVTRRRSSCAATMRADARFVEQLRRECAHVREEVSRSSSSASSGAACACGAPGCAARASAATSSSLAGCCRRRRLQRWSSLPVGSPRSSLAQSARERSRSRRAAGRVPHGGVNGAARATSSSRSASRRSPDRGNREPFAGERRARLSDRVERVVFAAQPLPPQPLACG